MSIKARDRGQGEVAAVLTGIVVVLLILVGATMLIGGTWSSTNASSMTCAYNGGWMDDNNFIGYEKPGAGRNYQGFASETNNVPVGIRQYRISRDESQGDVPGGDTVDARVKGYEMQFEPTVTFTISTVIEDGKPMACTFIERQLRQFGDPNFDSSDGGWAKYLNERFRPVLNDVAARVLQTYDPGSLKFNTNGARDKAAVEIGEQLKDALERSLGGDYFCDSTYSFGQGEAECGDSLTVILPEPFLTDPADETQLSKPQRAKIDADNEIAAAQEAARKAQQVADAKTQEADAAETLADANEKIANENARVITANVANDYAWCEYLTQLGQDCALVKAAENSDFPDVFLTNTDTSIAVPVPS